MWRNPTLSIVTCGLLLAIAMAAVRADEAPPAPATPVATAPTLAGVVIGDDAARVLSRLGLHAPGWARSPGSVGEMRMFPTKGGASMTLLFDRTIEMIGVKTASSDTQIGDSYGVKLGSTLTELIQLRGAPIAIRDEKTYVFEGSDSVRWEYELKDGKVDAITVRDCRIAGVCGPAS